MARVRSLFGRSAGLALQGRVISCSLCWVTLLFPLDSRLRLLSLLARLTHEAAQPAPCSQQPPPIVFSAGAGDCLLPGFVGAWLPGGCG